ncbi:hypothetical protein GGI02_005437, partial [Coemansia sp. RSA 2322]
AAAAEEAPVATVTDDDYEDVPAPERAEDYRVDDSPLELVAGADAEAAAEPEAERSTAVVRPRKMRVKLGLPAGYFELDRDDDFCRWDAKYPAVSRKNMQSLEPTE